MTFTGFWYEPVRLDVNEVCLYDEQDIFNTPEKLRKSQSITEWCRCEKCGDTEPVIERTIEFQRLT